ncbi:MAG: aldehyde dehydrogenase family protein, partial [Balneolaceae bacterium]
MEFLKTLGIEGINPGTSTGRKHLESKETISSYTPTDGERIATVGVTTREQYDGLVEEAQNAYKTWSQMPAPQRGEIIRQIGQKLREYKEPLGKLVTYEMGKIYQEGLG